MFLNNGIGIVQFWLSFMKSQTIKTEKHFWCLTPSSMYKSTRAHYTHTHTTPDTHTQNEINGRLIRANIFKAKLIKSIYRLNAFEKLNSWMASEMKWMKNVCIRRRLNITSYMCTCAVCSVHAAWYLSCTYHWHEWSSTTLYPFVARDIDKFPSESHVNIYRHIAYTTENFIRKNRQKFIDDHRKRMQTIVI